MIILTHLLAALLGGLAVALWYGHARLRRLRDDTADYAKLRAILERERGA